MTPRLPAAALLCAPLALPGLAFSAGQGSLEALLRAARAQRQTAREALAKPLDDLLAALAALSPNDKAGAQRIQRDLVALGVEAAPLLVRYLEPGLASDLSSRRRSDLVRDVLIELPTRAATEPLIELARSGSRAARVQALRVLGRSIDRERVLEAVSALARESTGEERAEALLALAKLGGPESDRLLQEALGDRDPEVLRAVLLALADSRSPAGREAVREIAAAAPLASELAEPLLDYFAAVGLQPEDAEALVRLAANKRVKREARLTVLRRLSDLKPEFSQRLEKLFAPLFENEDDVLRQAAELCAACMGDRNQRREILKRCDDLVARNENWLGAYEQRAAVLGKLGEHVAAAKDLERAIELYGDAGRDVPENVQVDLARAYVLSGNERRAYDALLEGGVSSTTLRTLADDPAFRPLAEHPRYGKVFK